MNGRAKFIMDFLTTFKESEFQSRETRRCLGETLDLRLTEWEAKGCRVIKEGMIRQSLGNPIKDPNPVAKG
ncbi:MAG: hypothetical protein CMF45_08785 [Legionellales bacterium]|nr:hypothetical protein [Legionellales bacterium]